MIGPRTPLTPRRSSSCLIPVRPAAAGGQNAEVFRYYRQRESLLGYALLLHGTKHFGYYDPGTRAWQFARAMRRMELELGRAVALPTDAFVLDAGCGMGRVAIFLATELGLRICGIDILGFNVAKARQLVADRRLEDRIQVAQMDYSALGLSTNSVDGIFTMETLVHAEDPKTVLDGFWRVLRPGGRLVLFEYSHARYDSMAPEVAQLFQELFRVTACPGFDYFEYGALESLMSATGFVVVEKSDLSTKMLPMLHTFAILGSAPYRLAKSWRFTDRLPNAMAGVELWRLRDLWRYDALTATKPSE